MSNKNNNNNLLVAGAVAAGFGALFGVAYGAYELYKRHQEEKEQQRTWGGLPGTQGSCLFCDKDFDVEETVTIGCGHEFHKKCLEANYVLDKYEKPRESYKCKYQNCGRHLTTAEIRSLEALEDVRNVIATSQA